MRVSTGMPDDVVVLHDALEALQEYQKSKIENQQSPLILHLKNCGTALRFLQVHLEQCYPGEPIELTGDERLMERKGKLTSQIDSARILHGLNVPVQENESPYITMSRELAKNYSISNLTMTISLKILKGRPLFFTNNNYFLHKWALMSSLSLPDN